MFCVAIWMWMSLLTYWNLNFSPKILVLQWLLGFILVYCSQIVKWYTFPKKLVWLLFIKTTHVLDMSCFHKQQQQSCHHEQTKTCMFIYYMCVDILFPLTKAIPVMFEHVTMPYQTLETWIDHNATRYHNFNALPHALLYIFSQFNMERP